MHPAFYIPILFLAFQLFWVVLIAAVAMWEKRMIWPYGPLAEKPEFGDITGYGMQKARDACDLGFVYFGWGSDVRQPSYRVSYSMLISPERDCFMLIGVGSIFGINLEATWLYTRTSTGDVYYTTDHQSGVEFDISGQWHSQLVPGGTFGQLLQKHHELLWNQGQVAKPLQMHHEIEDFHGIRAEHFREMARRGLIYFVEPEQISWKYTFWGACKLAFLNYTLAWLRTLTFGRFPRSA
jgi:hypothetical protein